MNCPNEILSVFMFPDDCISIQMLHSYFMMALLISRHPEGLRKPPPRLPYGSHLLHAVVHRSATPLQPWFSLSCPAPGGDASVGQMGFLDLLCPDIAILSPEVPSSAVWWLALPHLQLRTAPSGPEGSWDAVSATVLS